MSTPLSVVLSMLTFVPGGMGGTESYARALVERLAARDDVDVRTIVPGPARGFGPPGAETVVPAVTGGGTALGRVRSSLEASLNGRQVRRAMAGADVVHYPFTAVVPRPARGVPHVQTLHDLQHLDLPEFFSPVDKLYRRAVYERAARRADVVITISGFAKARIAEHLALPEDRIVVAPLGVDLARYTTAPGPKEEFVLYPARGWPHKNHARLVAAMEIVRRRRPGLRLVLTGGDLERLGPLPEWVDVRGLVSSEELQHLFRTASVLAFPSLYEGFGLPPLEAMASGCPVAASDVGSIPEVVGDAGVLFDPHDPESIAAGVEQAIERQDELVPLGLARAGTYTWEACADRHVEAYRRATA